MLIPSAYISFRRRNKRCRYFKVKSQYEDKPTCESGISEKVPIPPENYDSSSETEHDGEGLSLKDINKVVNQVAKHPASKLVNQVIDVLKHPADISKLVNQVTDVIKHPVDISKLVNQVADVIKHPDEISDIADILHRLVPVKGTGVANEEDQMTDNDANFDDAEIEDGEIDDECREPDHKVPKLEDSECFDDFQRDDDHIPSRIPPTENKKYPTIRCAGCKKHGIRRESRYFCKGCPEEPALCKDCFREYHM